MRRRAASAASTIRTRDAASCSRASAFASAAVTAAKLLICSSVPAGNACGSSLVTMIAPDRRPATWIGAPTADAIPNSRNSAASSPLTPV